MHYYEGLGISIARNAVRRSRLVTRLKLKIASNTVRGLIMKKAQLL